MYEFIIGTIEYVSPAYIVLNNNGMGFKINVANPYRFDEGKQEKIYVEQVVRENDMSLYGFVSLDEKLLFLKLLDVSGIGPKSALSILAVGDHSGLIAAIKEENPKYLMQFPGIGKKTAQQIILDLKGKIADLEVDTGIADATIQTAGNHASKELEDALEALSELGYASRDIANVKKKLVALEQMTTSQYISEALKLLVR